MASRRDAAAVSPRLPLPVCPLTHSIRDSSSKTLVSVHRSHRVFRVSAAGSASAFRPALVSVSLEPDRCARPPAWMRSGHAKARMGPAFSSCHLSVGGTNG